MKKAITILMAIMLLTVLLFTGCNNESDNWFNGTRKKQMNSTLDNLDQQIELPNISNFQQKKLLKTVYELCDKEDLICYVYLKADYSGDLVFIGKCIGFGISSSAQYINPTKLVDRYGDKVSYSHIGSFSLPQAAPNGLHMPISSSANWLMMINPETNEPNPVYIEPEVIVSPFKLK